MGGIRLTKESLEAYKIYQDIILNSIEIEKEKQKLESQEVDKSKESTPQYNLIHIEGLKPLEPVSTEGDDPLPISVTVVEDLIEMGLLPTIDTKPAARALEGSVRGLERVQESLKKEDVEFEIELKDLRDIGIPKK